ncbi:DUF1294 domain-containing protein [Clostridium vincentii]|uniref:DUF1294 domain-containing protein n=1 Tax=Clostridium vincentii TaxID=52704 RepID=A0A2T0BE59_9CLOT|nr:DUF1294 domain-containing protein [Clostridium vincentii]PRR82149.1 hypothetical protein CLVI_19490 [Clostridium vincentii]
MFEILIPYILAINLIGFIIMFIDKKKAVHRKWRISESTLITISILGGSIGMLLGMHCFRHKTNHKKFTLGVPAILIVQLGIILFFLQR